MTITKKGTLASFYTVNKAPIKHLKVYFSPKQAGSGDPSPSNVRMINGWQGLKVYQSGKNLVKLTEYTGQFFNVGNEVDLKKTTDRVSVSENNNVISLSAPDYPWYGCVCATDILPAGNYTIHTELSDNNVRRSAYSTDQNLITTNRWSLVQDNVTITLTESSRIVVTLSLQESGTIGSITNLQVEAGNNYTTYEPYRGHTYNPDWSNDIGTIYGGYIDLITGELVQEQIGRTFKGSDADQTTELTNTKKFRFRFYKALKGNGATKVGITYCDKLQYQYHEDDKLHYYFTDNNSNGNAYVYLPKDFGDNDEVTIIASLYTPELVTTLTPTQLQTFIGQNNIWSNADRVEVEYDLAESNDELYRRRNIILQGAPHLETATSDIANFNTDIVAPIKDAKIYFNPVQEGEGDPSLENIRPINGWTGLDINQTGKNLINPATNPIWKNGTYTINNDGSVTISGSDGRGWTSEQITPFHLSKGTYTFSWTGSKRVQFATSEDNYATVTTYAKNFTFTLNNDGYVKWKHTGDSSDYPETVYAQIEVGTNATPFESYKGNVVPITFPTVGKNLLDITRTEKINPGVSTSNITISNGVISIDAVASSARSYVLFSQEFPAGTYTIQVKKSGALGSPRLLTTSEISNSSYNTYYTLYSRQMTSDSLTFTLAQTSKIGLVLSNLTNESGNPGTFYDIQLESGSTATSYEPYTNTVYGGYVDLINGKLVQTYKKIDLGEFNWGYYVYANCSGGYTFGVTDSEVYNGNTIPNAYCSALPITTDNDFNNDSLTSASLTININNMIKVKIPNVTDAASLKSALSGIKLVYQLKTPIEYSLTPQTLKALKGVNNIWSNANGPVSITYWTH